MNYFTLRVIIILMETIKALYISADSRANSRASSSVIWSATVRLIQKIMGYSNHFVMAITSAEVKV